MATAAFAGCVSFTPPPVGSRCVASSAEVRWENAPQPLEAVDVPRRSWDPENSSYDRTIFDPAFRQGVYASGDVRLRLSGTGRRVVEVFFKPLARDAAFSLIGADGTVRDHLADTYWQWQHNLLAVIDGDVTLTLKTTAPRYLLNAVRVTPQDAFERDVVPPLRDRVRRLMANPFHDGPQPRPNTVLEQLYQRLAVSSQQDVHREGILGLTRVTYWRLAEAAQPSDVERLVNLFDKALKLAPQDPILRQTISSACSGQNQPMMASAIPKRFPCQNVAPLPWSASLPPAPPNAPAWALVQREIKARLDAITRWWIEKRQQVDGQLGGGWGDDVEMLRSWGPQALGLGSEIGARGVRSVATGLWNSGSLLHGYSRAVSDAEHSAEDTADTQPLLAATFPDDPEILARLKLTSECAKNWIQRQPDGYWRFRGAWFNCREFDPQPKRALDVWYNVRAMGPALWYAYLTREPWLVELIGKWAESWVAAMRSARHGKPAGIFPSVIRSSDGEYLIGSDRWDRPSAEWDYHFWSGGSQQAITSLILAAYDLTGDNKWLGAVEESFQVLESCERYPDLCSAITGAPESFYEWRRLTGNPRYDRHFSYAEEQSSSASLLGMERQGREMLRHFSVNFDMLTSEALFTDRVNPRWPANYKLRLFGGDAPRGERYPNMAVTWPAAQEEFARAVIEAKPDSLKLVVYSFEPRPIQASLRAWRLRPGRFRWTSEGPGGRAYDHGELIASGRAQAIQLPVPPQTELTVVLYRIAK